MSGPLAHTRQGLTKSDLEDHERAHNPHRDYLRREEIGITIEEPLPVETPLLSPIEEKPSLLRRIFRRSTPDA